MPSDNDSKTQKSVSTSEPYKPSQPGLNQSIKDATGLYNSGGLNYQYFPGKTVAPLAPETQQAWGNIAQRAQDGSPLNTMSQDYVTDVLGGKYLNAEAPGFKTVLDRTRNDVNANKALSGRYGSGSHDAAVAEATGGLRYQNYQNERGIQDSAARFAPQLAQQDYFDLQQLQGVGQQRQGHLQDQINEEINRFNFDQNAPANSIALYQSLLGGQMGGTTTATAPVQNQSYNPFTSFAGGALQTLPYFFGA